MKTKAIIIGLLTLLTLLSTRTYSKESTTSIWKLAAVANNNDSTSATTIVVDTNQIEFLKSLVSNTDGIVYYSDLDGLLTSKIDPLQTKVEGFQKGVDDGVIGGTKKWVLVLLFTLVVIVFVLTIIIVIMHNRMIEINERIDHRKGEIKKLQEINNDSNNSNRSQVAISFKNKMIELERMNKELLNKVSLLESKLKEIKVSSNSELVSSTGQQSSPKPIISQKLLYADSIIDGEFSHVWEKENDDTVFVLTQKAENRASININKRAYGKVLANASFLDGCDKQVLPNSTTVEIICEGEAERGANGKWKVVSPLRVELK